MSASTDHPGLHDSAPPAVAMLVHLNKGQPVTDSLAISREFGRTHKNVLQSLDALIADGTINRLEFKPVKFKDAKGEQRRMIELTERGALIAMPFIGGKNSRAGQVRLVDAFLAMRDDRASHVTDDWTGSRRKVSTAYQMMADALQEVRADDGKTTGAHHYSNEARLVNWILFGRFDSIDRDQMAHSELILMEKIQAKNAIWIVRGRTYDERKAALPAYLLALRTKGSLAGRKEVLV